MAIASYERKGDLIEYTNSTKAAIAYHQVLAIGSITGVAMETIDIGAKGSVAIVGVFGLPTSATTIKAGAAVYWDTKTDAAVAESSTTTAYAGIATADAADGIVAVKLGAGK